MTYDIQRYGAFIILSSGAILCAACSDDGNGNPDGGSPADGDISSTDGGSNDSGTDADRADHDDGSTQNDSDVDGDEPVVRSPVQPFRENPFYWEHNGQPMVLIGGTWQDNPFQWADGHDDNILTEQLDLLQSVGGNYLRNVINCRQRAFPELSDEGMASPFTEAGGLFDLSDYNEDFFQRLRTFLEMTEQRGFIIETELWDGPLAYHVWTHPRNPWRPSQNVNYDESEVIISNGSGRNFYYGIPAIQDDPILLGYQEDFIDQVLDVTLDFDHVVYTLENESNEDPAFSDHWAAFVHVRAASRGKTVFVTDHRQIYSMDSIGLSQNHFGNVINNPDVYGYVHESTLSSCYAQTQYDANIAIRELLVSGHIRPMNYDKSFWYIQCFRDPWSTIRPGNDHLASERLWIGIFSGAAAYRFHRDLPAPEGWPMGLGLNGVAQTHLRSMRMLLDEIDIFNMEPRNDFITSERDEAEAFVLAAPGQEYAIYLAGQRVRLNGSQEPQSTTLDNRVVLSIDSGDYSQDWLDIDGNSWSSENVIAGGEVTLDLPDGEQWAVVLRRHGD